MYMYLYVYISHILFYTNYMYNTNEVVWVIQLTMYMCKESFNFLIIMYVHNNYYLEGGHLYIG